MYRWVGNGSGGQVTETTVVGVPGPGMPDAAIPSQVGAPRAGPGRPRIVRRRIGATGLLFATLFFCLSLTPSLLPRSWLLLGLAGGISAVVGYAIGAVLGWGLRRTVRWRPSEQLRRRAWLGLGTSCTALVVVFLWRGVGWQDEIRQLMGMGPVENPAAGRTLLTAVALAGVVLLAARTVRLGTRTLDRWIGRFVPRTVADVIGAVLTGLLVATLLHGLVSVVLVDLANRVFSLDNGRTEIGVTQPSSPYVSGGPGSLVAWSTLGLEGRSFTARGPTTAELTAFSGRPSIPPIRVYAGLESADSPQARAALAVRELERTGAFDREVLAVVATTGTGWVAPDAADSLDFLYNGDTAQVAVQFSYLPSWISFLVDGSKAVEAGVALNDAVLARWQALPVESRPKLVLSGTSLGSYGVEATLQQTSALPSQIDAALLIGPTNANPIWRSLTAARRPGTPAWHPVVDAGQTVQFADSSGDVGVSAESWPTPRVLYMQNGSDPVTWWSVDLLFARPDWLDGSRPPDVSPQMRWYPVVTFCQVTLDLVAQWDVPDGHGHRYVAAPARGWVDVLSPPEWTKQDTDRLVSIIVERDLTRERGLTRLFSG